MPEDQKSQLIQSQYRLQTGSYWSAYPDSTHDVIEIDGRAAGRIWVARMESEIRVLDIGLLPWTRDQGVGSAVIDRIKAEATEAGKPITSTVLRTNAGSLRWQIRMGFRITREDEFHHYMEWRADSATALKPEPDPRATPSASSAAGS